MHNASIYDGKMSIHNISNFKACYDRELFNLECIVQEAVGVKREVMKIIQQVILIIQHHFFIDFGISK